jgi:hypothetical protein
MLNLKVGSVWKYSANSSLWKRPHHYVIVKVGVDTTHLYCIESGEYHDGYLKQRFEYGLQDKSWSLVYEP